MTTPFLRRTSYAFACLLLSLTLASCDVIEGVDERCGHKVDAKSVGDSNATHGPNATFGNNVARMDSYRSELRGGRRFYQYLWHITGVCSQENVVVRVSVSITDELLSVLSNLRTTANVQWGTRGQSIALDETARISLSPEFGDESAAYWVILGFEFDSLGSRAEDEEFFQNLLKWEITTTYFQYEPASN